MLGGLNEALSPGEVDALRDKFTVSGTEAAACEKEDYYATTLPAGPARLGEMLEESAFYSEHLQQISAFVMLCVLVFFAVVFIVIAFGVTPYVARDTGHTTVRVFLSLLVFAMSADVIGAYRCRILGRFERGVARDGRKYDGSVFKLRHYRTMLPFRRSMRQSQ